MVEISPFNLQMKVAMKSTIYDWKLKNKVVLLRIDANVPLDQGAILNDQRLVGSLATINLLLDKGSQIVLLSHLGRPHDHESELSTRQLIPWFYDTGYDIVFADSIEKAKKQLSLGHKIVLLENLRFFKEEQEPNLTFAKELASLGEYYVDDAFGTLHRNDSSITLLPTQFDTNHKSIGLLVEHELSMLDAFLKNIIQPFVLIIGGGKVADKIPLIESLLPKLSALMIGPGLVFTFLKTEGKSIGKSLVDNNSIALCQRIISRAEQLQVPIYYPLDYIVAEKCYEGELNLTDSDEISPCDVGISIGPKTAAQWSGQIGHAKTILLNGLMGSMNNPESLIYVNEVFKAISHNSKATSIIAGGDSVAAAYYFNVAQDISYLSTGGGVTLEYMSGHELPGLTALKNGTET